VVFYPTVKPITFLYWRLLIGLHTVLWLRFFLNLSEVFPCFFPSCKANARVKLAKTGHGPHSSTLVVICVVLLLFVLFGRYLCCSMYCLCVNVYWYWVTTQLQLINTSSYRRNLRWFGDYLCFLHQSNFTVCTGSRNVTCYTFDFALCGVNTRGTDDV